MPPFPSLFSPSPPAEEGGGRSKQSFLFPYYSSFLSRLFPGGSLFTQALIRRRKRKKWRGEEEEAARADNKHARRKPSPSPPSGLVHLARKGGGEEGRKGKKDLAARAELPDQGASAPRMTLDNFGKGYFLTQTFSFVPIQTCP